MSALAEAYVRIRPDATGFGRELDKQTGPQLRRFENQLKGSNRELSRFSRGALVGTGALGGLGRAAAFASASFIGGAGLVYGIKTAIGAASNLNEQTSKTKVVFGDASDAVIAFSKDALLLAQDQALDTASSIGALLRPLGVIPKQAADTSITLTKLGVDLSSFYNTSVADALAAIKSGLVGEVEPLRRYGVVLSEARVQQEAFVETGKDNAAQLTNQEKVLARVNLILRDTKQAQGDAERTAGGFANQQRELAKNIRNTEILIGQTLIPTLTDYLKKANEWLGQTKNQERIQRDVNQAVRIGAKTLDVFATAVGGVSTALSTLHDAPGGDKGLIEIFADDDGQLSRTARMFGGAMFNVADALGLVADNTRKVATAEELLWASHKRLALQPATGIFGIPNELFEAMKAGIPEPTVPGKKQGPPSFGPAPSANATRNDLTATALARAEAEGNRAQITAAANARIGFIRDTITFANKLLSEGRGDTAKLQQTLQAFYGEQASVQAILDQFAQDDANSAQAAADARQRRIDDAKQRNAEWREQNHALQLVFEDAIKQGKAWTDEFWRKYAEDVQNRIDLQDQRLQNAVELARLIPNAEKALAAERKADQHIVKVLAARVESLKAQKAGALAIARAKGDLIAAQLTLKNLSAKDGSPAKKARAGGGGFSLEDLFQEAGSEFQMYGSNVGNVLSPQDARGSFAGTVKTHQTTVVQNFYGERSAGQALQDAAQVARNMKD